MYCLFLGIPGQSLKCLEVKEFASQLEVAGQWSLFNRPAQSQFSKRTLVFKTLELSFFRFSSMIAFDLPDFEELNMLKIKTYGGFCLSQP